MKNIVETADESGSFQVLVKAIKEADLVGMLSSKGPYTVFAPTDDAFHKLPEGIMEDLMEDKDRLKEILAYHVSAGKIRSDELRQMSESDTLQGEPVTISIEGEYLMIDNSKVIKSDIECENGTIHVIDMVLMP